MYWAEVSKLKVYPPILRRISFSHPRLRYQRAHRETSVTMQTLSTEPNRTFLSFIQLTLAVDIYLLDWVDRRRKKKQWGKSVARHADVKRDFIFAMACPMPYENYTANISFQRLYEPIQYVSISTCKLDTLVWRYVCVHCTPPCAHAYNVLFMRRFHYEWNWLSPDFQYKNASQCSSNYRGHL